VDFRVIALRGRFRILDVFFHHRTSTPVNLSKPIKAGQRRQIRSKPVKAGQQSQSKPVESVMKLKTGQRLKALKAGKAGKIW
jgi:hypothetical protein